MADQAVADDAGADDHALGAWRGLSVTGVVSRCICGDLCLSGSAGDISLPYHRSDMSISLSEQAYQQIRRMIVRLDLAPGAVVREDELQRQLGIGRTPIREALQRLVRDQFVTVMPRRGMFVSRIDVAELSMLYETRAILEPYAARLACARGAAGALGRDGGVLVDVPSGRRVAGRVARHRSRVPRDHLGRRRATASSPTRSTCCTPRATGCGTCTSPTSPTCCHAVDEHRRDPRRPASTVTAIVPPSSPPPTSARSTNRSATPSPAASAHPSPAPETPTTPVLSASDCPWAHLKQTGRGFRGSSGQPGRFWTCWKPKRPLMQRLPWVTGWSGGDITLTIVLSWTCSDSVQPTPQYGQIVSVTAWRRLVPRARPRASGAPTRT